MRYVTNTCRECGGTYEFLDQEIGREWVCPQCGVPIILAPGPSLAELRRAERWKQTKVFLRWMAVLPASVGGVFLAMLASFLLQRIAPWDPEQFEWLIQLGTSAGAGVAFVAAGANTAPSHRFVTALALTVIHAVGYTVGFAFILSSHSETVPIWWLAVCSVAALVGSICACVVLHREEIQGARAFEGCGGG